jgi:hypothetical protein
VEKEQLFPKKPTKTQTKNLFKIYIQKKSNLFYDFVKINAEKF